MDALPSYLSFDCDVNGAYVGRPPVLALHVLGADLDVGYLGVWHESVLEDLDHINSPADAASPSLDDYILVA